MEYSALIFDNCKSGTESYDHLETTISVFQADEDCKQIVVSCSTQWLVRLAQAPSRKILLVQMSDTPYVALLNGLKAVSQENVVVCTLDRPITEEDVRCVLLPLHEYPAVLLDDDLQAYDTRLLMFSLQMAIETNIQIDSYAMAVEKLSNLPIRKVNGESS